jgi:hypothetical protein
MITEFRIYKLKENTAKEFEKIFTEKSLPLMKKRNVNIVDYGFSLIDKNSLVKFVTFFLHFLQCFKTLHLCAGFGHQCNYTGAWGIRVCFHK